MIDSVLKGTGNSRFLKSAVPAGTSWADALAMLQAGTFPIDFNGINTEGFQQVGTPLNKANLLKDATALTLGLTGDVTPDDMFNVLAHAGDLYVWRKTEKVGSKGYYLDTVSSGQLCIVNSSAYVVTFSYSSTVSAEGVLTGTVNTVSLSGTNDQTSKLSVLRGKFCKAESNGSSNSVFAGIIYIPNDATFTYQIDNGDYRSHHVSKKQTVVFTDAPTTTTYPVSTNPNAYQEGSDAKPAGYVLGDVVTGRFMLEGYYNSSHPTYYYADNTPTVSDDGVVSVKDIYGFSGYGSGQDALQTRIRGKYIQCRVDDYTQSDFRNLGVVYIPEDAVVLQYNSASGVYIDRYQPVTGYAAIPAGTTIEYLGKLGDKARVQVVSYVGTGTYGAKNPCSITADFKIKVARFVAAYKHGGSNGVSTTNAVMTGDSLTTSYQEHMGTGSSSGYYAKKSSDGKTFSWYQTSSSTNQLNYSGAKYWVLIIG